MSHEALLAQRVEATKELATAARALEQLRTLRANGFDDDEHDPDGMPLSTEMVRLAGLVNATTQRLAHIDSALNDLDHGRYGLCAECGLAIAPERLEVRPTATRCIDCAR